ncbi:hypothetical protein B0A49_13080 [Cryomyces minteri]|uniref:UBX domain-containing protein n=2 Tax=Cryomyces minteri TaxID=331657 RepID=A0A4U0VJE9_9PEZI|nr:hypothetical protein B0A49_13080 [Cryomyces minteri]
MDDDLISQFSAITSADVSRAQQYLTLTEGNLEQAIQLYFDSDGMDMGASVPQAPQTSASHHQQPSQRTARPQTYAEDEDGVVQLDSDNESDLEMDNPTAQARLSQSNARTVQPPYAPATAATGVMEDDETMARRLQEEMYGGGNMAGGSDPDAVRAPMSRTTETLVGPNADWRNDPNEMRAAIAEQMLARQQQRGQGGGRPGIFNQRPIASVWDDDGADEATHRQNLAAATGGASENSSKSTLLADLFRPPFELMTHQDWEGARAEGKDLQRWILVNVQDPAIFDCQVLNRDIWKNPQVKETVKENFIFMQYTKNDPRGGQYINYYFHARDSQDAYPHIAIVDPRTGEQVKVWSGPPVPKPVDFVMELHEFLDRYSLDASAKNPVATRRSERKTVDVNRMTEEEMLEMALKNSMANNGGPKEDDPDALTKAVGTGKGKEKVVDPEDLDVMVTGPAGTNGTTEPPVSEPSPFSLISSTDPHTEPAVDPATTTRIQFRHSGGRVIRRFAVLDPVRRIYEWLKATPFEGKEGVSFELISLAKNLIDSLESTIEEAGLKNGTIMVEFLED